MLKQHGRMLRRLLDVSLAASAYETRLHELILALIARLDTQAGVLGRVEDGLGKVGATVEGTMQANKIQPLNVLRAASIQPHSRGDQSLLVFRMVILMSLKVVLPVAEQVSTPPGSEVIETRRRPGRLKKVSPALVPLLRSPATADIHKPSLSEADARLIEDDLGAVKGIIFALALSVQLWVSISAMVWVAVR